MAFVLSLAKLKRSLLQHPAVKETVVLAREDTPGEKRLVAYVVFKERESLSNDDLRVFLKQLLPDYMVPAAFVVLEKMPLTHNGKLDRKALPAPEYKATHAYVAPRNELEQTLCQVFQDVLHLEKVGIMDNFFEVGGDSLLAMQITAHIRRDLKLEIPLRTLFEKTTVAEFSEEVKKAQKTTLTAITVANRNNRLPLSFAQQRLWFLDKFTPNSNEYNTGGAIRLHGHLNIKALNQAFRYLIGRHEILRTYFKEDENGAYQYIQQKLPFTLEEHHLENADKQEALLTAYLEEVTQITFNLSEGPLLKAGLVFLDNQESILWVAMHHIISDGWSVTIFIQELALAYNAYRQHQVPQLTPLTIQYADYSAWQRQYLAEGSQTLKTQLDFWTRTLADAPTLLNLPTDKPRPALRSAAGTQLAFLIDKNLSDGLKALADKEQVSLFMLLVAAFSVLLARHSGQNDILIGTPTANRKQAEVENLLGCFINTLVLRTTIKPYQSFKELLQQVKQNTLDAFAHQDLPFEDLVDHLHVERSLSHTPLFQVMLVLQNTEQADFNLDGLTVQSQSLSHNTAKFDLTMELQETEEGLSGSLEYATDLFIEETMQRLLDHWLLLLQGMVAQPQTVIHRLPFLSQEEQQRLVDWNHNPVDYPKEQTITSLFEEQVQKTPDAIALVFEDQTLSYRELNEKANQLAHYLVEQGVKSETLVALCFERSIELVIAILAILKAGAAYVPLDPNSPKERLHYVMQDANTYLVMTQPHLAELFTTKTIILDHPLSLVCTYPKLNLKYTHSPSNLAYVIYTSGSTGKPKGVGIVHSSIVNHMLWMKAYNAVTENDVFLQKTPYSFDFSVVEFFLPLISGSTMIMAKPDGHKDPIYLAKLMNQYAISFIHFVPSMLAVFLNEAAATLSPQPNRRILVGGEALTLDIHHRLFAAMNVEFYNTYGPTETAIDASAYLCKPEHNGLSIPIGKPLWNAELYILDNHLTPTGIGIPGELYIAGEGLARGYLNRPDLTSEYFIANPFSEKPGARMYKSGDLCRYLPDGNIEYLGRLDHQVKIRGFRIELGEIEARLLQHSAVKETVVLAREDTPGEKRLVAYMVFKERASSSNDDLRAFLKQLLPDYMVPAAFVILENMPLTHNGKLDRKALPAPEYKATQAYVAPRNELEQTLCQIFQDVLHLEKIGIMDNFFEVGGNSLLATQITAHIRRDLKLEIPLRTLFEKTTVAEFSEEVKKAQKTTLTAITVANRNNRLPLSFAQQRLWFLDKFTPNSNEYNIGGAIRLHGHLNIKALNQAFRYLIGRHEILRTYFKEDENGGYQYIQQKLPFKLQEHHLENADKQEALLTAYLEEVTQITFNLSEGPLLKAGLVFLDNQESILWVAMHHIISDGWSVTIFIQELALAYNAYRQHQVPQLTPLTIQYADYSAWQRQYLAEGSQTLKTQLDFWTRTLADAPTLLNLPTDKPRPALRSAAGTQLAFLIDKNLSDGLKALADKEQVSLFMLLVAAFSVLLARHSGQNDILIGTPTANRKQAEVENLLGCFINTLVLRTTIKPYQSFKELLQQVKQNTLDAFAHQDLPFEDLVDHLHVERSLNHTPLFQVMLILQNIKEADFNLDGLTVQSQPLPHNTAKFDLTMELQETEEGLSGSLEYATDLFLEETMQRLLDHWLLLLQGMVAQPQTAIHRLPFLSQEEQQRLVDWNNTFVDYPKEQTLQALFEAQVEKNPDATALVFEGQTLSYRELNEKANQLAHYLVEQGVKPDTLVALCLERSFEMMIAILGILKAGAAYVPLDPENPVERLHTILDTAKPNCLFCLDSLQSVLAPLFAGKLISLSQMRELLSQEKNKNNPKNKQSASTMCYTIFTSGSTGTPKGVANIHSAVVNCLLWMKAYNKVTEQDVILQKTPYTFDVSVAEFLLSFVSGSTLVIAKPNGHKDPNYLAELINQHGITLLHFVPSMLAAFLNNRAFLSLPRPSVKSL